MAISALATYREKLRDEARQRECEVKAEERLTEAFISAHMRAKAVAIGASSNYKARPTKPIIDYYAHVEARNMGVTRAVFMTSLRQDIAHARFRVWRRLRNNYGYSLPAIGEAFARDHTTILYGLRKLERLAA